MNTTKMKWTFSLFWINLAVAIVVLIQVVSGQTPSVREAWRVLAYALVYANLTGVLGILVIGGIAERLAARRTSVTSGAVLGVALVTPVGCLLAQTLLMAMGLVVPRNFWQEYLHTLRIAVPLAVVFGLGAAIHGTLRGRLQTAEEKLREKEVMEERSRKLAAEARLKSLESRIQPHFLFNTLNSISALIPVDPARAEQIVGRLAVLLRASLDASQQPLIPLRQELAMVESYAEIERARFGDKLRGSVQVPAELMEAMVPPMSVQSLVENAVKHGITPRSGGGEFLVTAASENGRLRIEVRDTGPGFDLTSVPPGHGLDSLVERLDTLFGERAQLKVSRRDGCCVVEMVLPTV